MELQDRHLTHYVAVAEAAFVDWLADHTSGKVVFEREWDNLRAAARHALARRDAGALERLFAAIQWHALYQLRFEVGDWADDAAGIDGVGASTFGASAFLAAFLGQVDRAVRSARAGIAAAARPDAPETFTCWLALCLAQSGRDPQMSAYDALLAASRTRALGKWGEALMAAVLPAQEVSTDPASAAGRAQRAEQLLSELRSPALAADASSNLGLYYGLAGDRARGIAYCRAAIELARQHDLKVSLHTAYAFLVQLAVMDGSEDPVPVLIDEIERAHTDGVGFHFGMMAWALVGRWLAHGRFVDAAVAVGHLDAWNVRGFGYDGYDEARATLRARPELETWFGHGAGLDRDQFVTFILDRYRGRETSQEQA
jgi:hypothetical protein